MPWGVSVAVLAVLLVAALLGMRRGWRSRAVRTAQVVPALPARPDDLGAQRCGPLAAVYVSSTLSGQPWERIAAQGLGARSEASVRVHDAGVLIERTGTRDLLVPAPDLRAVVTAAGMAGKVVGGEGLVVLTWQAPGGLVDTGLRLRHGADRPTLLAAAGSLLETAHPTTGTETPR